MQQNHFISRLLSLGKRGSFILTAAAGFSTLLGTISSQAGVITSPLSDRNSSVMISPTTSSGVENWTVDGTNELKREWFWIGTGNSGGQSSIDSLGLTNSSLLDTNGDGKNDTAKYTYGSSHGLQIMVTLSLTGGKLGSGTSDLAETMKIINNGSPQMDYHVFEYTNFNLDGLTTGQTAVITGGNTATVTGEGITAQTVVSPKPSEFDAANFPTLLNRIASPTTFKLPDVASSSAGDSEWAFEWDLPLCTGNCAVISTDKTIKGQPVVAAVPEPSGAVALAGVSALYLLAVRPRRRDLI